MRRKFHISKYNWDVEVHLLLPTSKLAPILASLRELNPKDKDFIVARNLMLSKGTNWGFTFSSYEKRKSLVVIGPANGQDEYFNTIVHETYHLAKHIASCDNLDPYSESVAYLAGDMVQSLYVAFRDVVCRCNKKAGT